MKNKKRAVFLDRDGVIVRGDIRDGRPFAVTSLEDFHIFPESADVAELLHNADYLLVVVTNQPDVGNGLVERSVVETMNRQLAEAVALDAIKVCFHSQTDDCSCRKPKPGMLLEAARELDIDLPRSFMVGDRWSDMDAGRAAGCRTVFLDRNYDEKKPVSPDMVVDSLLGAANYILGQD